MFRIKHYIRPLVYGANDGIVTTFAVVSGVVGGGLSSQAIVIIGLASLFADGFSMAASDYLSTRTAIESGEKPDRVADRHPIRSALATFAAFIVAGALPLAPYLIPGTAAIGFPLAIAATAFALALVGALRTRFTRRSPLRGAAEMLAIGGAAAAIAYGVGALLRQLIGTAPV
ncbi:MAG: VIT1/CCC1 transporter family protein [Wenzhouxiangellaceae bacterium]|nr:VIT1/CCC1 transporter family protein [Wenzhouxiangellaceae bacterium]